MEKYWNRNGQLPYISNFEYFFGFSMKNTKRSVLITGGTGSFGSALAKRLIKDANTERVVIFSRDEWKQWQMKESDPLFSDPKVRFFLGDIRDKERLHRAFVDVDTIIHAAALKQVPAAEYNPTEFIQTNVMGSMNVADAALNSEVRQVIALSTDKAVNPINLYGATKLCADKLFTAANVYQGKRGRPLFSVVRYGNVLGSRGSLIPQWKSLVQQGATSLPLTSPEMTRFWITIEQTVDFVMKSLERQIGGEIFVPKIPSVYIKDLAVALFGDIPLHTIGVRPGEKIHEVLISRDDASNVFEWDDHYRIMPSQQWHKDQIAYERLGGHKVAPDFALTSDSNPFFETSIDKIKQLLSQAKS